MFYGYVHVSVWCCNTSVQLRKVWNPCNILIYLSFYSSDDGANVQEVLSEITNQRTVPNIFVNKVHMGGCDRTFQVMYHMFLMLFVQFVFKSI